MKKITVIAAIVLIIACVTGCALERTETILIASQRDMDTFKEYAGAFGHVRVLGDIDHILKGEKVDDEPGVTTQSMVAGDIAFNSNKTELTIPLTLTKYDFDGHRNPEDPEPEKYTRIATGTITLVLKGAVNAEGVGFVVDSYVMNDVDLSLSCDDSTYVYLDLEDLRFRAEELTGDFVTGKYQRTPLTVTLTDGKPTGIADVNTPKFGNIQGNCFLNNGQVLIDALI